MDSMTYQIPDSMSSIEKYAQVMAEIKRRARVIEALGAGARAWHAATVAQAGQPQSSLELGLSERCSVGWAAVPRSGRHGSMQPRVPDTVGGHLHRWRPRCSRAGCVDCPPRQAAVYRQRQRNGIYKYGRNKIALNGITSRQESPEKTASQKA